MSFQGRSMTRLSLVVENKLSVRAQPRAFQLRNCIFPGEAAEIHIVTEISACTAVQNVHISLSSCLQLLWCGNHSFAVTTTTGCTSAVSECLKPVQDLGHNFGILAMKLNISSKNQFHCWLCGLCGSVLAYFYAAFSFTLVQILWQKVEVINLSQRFLTMSIVFEQKASFYIVYKCCPFFWLLFYFQQATHLTPACSFHL